MTLVQMLNKEQLTQRWQQLAGLNGGYMIQPSHRPYGDNDIGTGPIPSLETVLDNSHAFIVEAHLKIADRSYTIRQQNQAFAWRETCHAEIPESAQIKKILTTQRGIAFGWVEVWEGVPSPLHSDFIVERPSFGYFDGFTAKDGQ